MKLDEKSASSKSLIFILQRPGTCKPLLYFYQMGQNGRIQWVSLNRRIWSWISAQIKCLISGRVVRLLSDIASLTFSLSEELSLYMVFGDPCGQKGKTFNKRSNPITASWWDRIFLPTDKLVAVAGYTDKGHQQKQNTFLLNQVKKLFLEALN